MNNITTHTLSTCGLIPLLLALLFALGCGDDDGGGGADTTSNGTTSNATASNATTGETTPSNTTVGTTTSGETGATTGGTTTAPQMLPCEGELEATASAQGAMLEGTLSALNGFRLQMGPGVVPEGTRVAAWCGAIDIAPEDTVVLSPPIAVGGLPGVRGGEAMEVQLTFDPERMAAQARTTSVQVWVRFPNGTVRAPALPNLRVDREEGRVRFRTRVFGVYQVAIPADAGQPWSRRYTYRAVTGVSMGAAGSGMLGFRHPELFDSLGLLGGAIDWSYMIHYIRGAGFGGFCPDADPADPDTWSCDTYQPTQEFEHAMRFDGFYTATGDGDGGSFDRNDYINIFQDLTYIIGNLSAPNPESPYLPAGLPLEEALKPGSEVCPDGGYTIPTGYYDDEFNPDGSLPVITFCDGRSNNSLEIDVPFDRYCDIAPADGMPDQPFWGYYSEPETHTRPAEIGLAVDYNGNGLRDRGEPVIRNSWEPWDDVGSDGLANVDEPGFDPVLNPDPTGDDYDPIYNPWGEEGDWIYEEGEPYRDVGLDGVEGTPQQDEGGYDVGEGNGRHDVTPAMERAKALDPRSILREMDEQERQAMLSGLDIFSDGGIRDLFNFVVTNTQIIGAIQGYGRPTRVYDGYAALAGIPEGEQVDVLGLDYRSVVDNVLVRYGNPKADERAICLGDGKHVGDITQAINRILIMLGTVLDHFPKADRTVVPAPWSAPNGVYWFDAPRYGGSSRYTIALPPGYEGTQCSDGQDNDGDGLSDGEDPDCTSAVDRDESGENRPLTRCSDGVDNDRDGNKDSDDPDCEGPEDDSESEGFEDKRYPVVYLLHGYGQNASDLQPAVLLLGGYMANGTWPKAIVVFPEGSCTDISVVTQCSDGVDNDGDGLLDGEDPECDGNRRHTNEGSTDPLPMCNDGVDNDRDGGIDVGGDRGCRHPDQQRENDCNRGTFYTDHVAYPNGDTPGPAFEGAFLDLIEHIDATYQTRPPEEVEVIR